MNDDGIPILTDTEARKKGWAVKRWSTMGLDATEAYAVVTDPMDPLGSLVGYYATLALASAACDAAGSPRPTILVRQEA